MPSGRTNNLHESGRDLGHVTPTILAVRAAILATAWLLVRIVILPYQPLTKEVDPGLSLVIQLVLKDKIVVLGPGLGLGAQVLVNILANLFGKIMLKFQSEVSK